MARRNVADCVKAIKNASHHDEMTDEQAKELLARMDALAKERAKKLNGDYEKALREIEGELVYEDKLLASIDKRNRLLTIQAKRRIKDFASRFPTIGEGLRAFLEGSNKNIMGARNSVDYQSRAIHGKYFGRMVAEMEEADVFTEFRKGDLEKEIYIEMGEIGLEGGRPGRSGSVKAQKIAEIIHNITDEMVSRQNRAGAYITKKPGYVMRQSHDRMTLRRAGATQKESFEKWSEFIMPLLDHEATFKGNTPRSFLRLVHEGLYTGIHGRASDEAEIDGFALHGSLAKKSSSQRVLHFKDAESAFEYNQTFGTKHLRDGIISDLLFRSRNIVLMENLGPNPEYTFRQVVSEMGEASRTRDDGGVQSDSLRDWKLEAAFNEVTGLNDIPQNVSLHRISSSIASLARMSKMGGVVLTSLGDKAFLQSEMAFQGISGLQTLAHQITGMLPRGADRKRSLRLMGVALDGLMGNVARRYSFHSSAGALQSWEQKFFKYNFLSQWTDLNKATAAELMAGHMGEYSMFRMTELPDDLQRVLNTYEISETEWNLARSTVYDAGDAMFVTPDKFSQIRVADIIGAIREKGLKPTSANIQRFKDELETKFRTYFKDRADFAVPTPGAAQKKWTTFNTRSGTPIGEALRTFMLLKGFPITVFSKIMGRDVYGRGSPTFMHWLQHDHKGKFAMAQLIALTTIGGYLSGVMKDALKGRGPKELITDGKINMKTLNDAALRGGGMGIMGDFLFAEYDRRYRSFLGTAAGPVFGQLDQLGDIYTRARAGDNVVHQAGKLAMENTPYINLFYTRPILDYYVLWNIQEMMDPGSLRRMESTIEENNAQEFFMRPSDLVR